MNLDLGAILIYCYRIKKLIQNCIKLKDIFSHAIAVNKHLALQMLAS